MVFYIIGMLFSNDEMKRLLNLQRACLILILCMSLSGLNNIVKNITMQIGIPYFVMSLALCDHPAFAGFGKKYDLSYGMYLYGFFMQQLVCGWFLRKGYETDYLTVLLISLALTLVAAWINAVCIEKPLSRMKRKEETERKKQTM